MDRQMKREKALLVYNPAAGRQKGKEAFWEATDYLFSAGYDVDIHFTQKATDAYTLAKQHGGECDLLVSCGGDGTLNEVVGGMMASGWETPLCHLPLGTTNDMAKTLHLPRKLPDVMALSESQQPIHMDAGMLNNVCPFIYVAAFGAFADVSYNTPREMKNKLGYGAYLLNGARAIKDIRPCRATVTTDTAIYTGEFLYGSVSNSASIGGILHLDDSQMSLTDGKFELLLIRKPETVTEWLNVAISLARNQFDGEMVILESTRQADFAFEAPVAWTLDGESAGSFQSVQTDVRHDAYQIFGNLGTQEQEHPQPLLMPALEMEHAG